MKQETAYWRCIMPQTQHQSFENSQKLHSKLFKTLSNNPKTILHTLDNKITLRIIDNCQIITIKIERKLT